VSDSRFDALRHPCHHRRHRLFRLHALTAMLLCPLLACGDEDPIADGPPEADMDIGTDTAGDADAATEDATPEDTADDGAPTDTTGIPDYDSDVRINEITMRCTHNSYHRRPEVLADPSHDYEHAPLDVQLGEQGVRAFELDVHAGEGFPVFHIPYGVDDLTTCENIGACMGTIATWSRANPGHHLVVVWVEIKDELDLERITDYAAYDAALRAAVPEDQLYTPLDFRRGMESERASVDALGWPTVDETRGQILVVLLDTDEPHASGYRAWSESNGDPVMFTRADDDQYGEPWAVIAKINNPTASEEIAAAHAANMMIASNTGSPSGTAEENQSRRNQGVQNGVHMLCDDYPAPVPERDPTDWLELPGGSPSICNQVTASEVCQNGDIERHSD
jgi:hypothetical protein